MITLAWIRGCRGVTISLVSFSLGVARTMIRLIEIRLIVIRLIVIRLIVAEPLRRFVHCKPIGGAIRRQ